MLPFLFRWWMLKQVSFFKKNSLDLICSNSTKINPNPWVYTVSYQVVLWFGIYSLKFSLILHTFVGDNYNIFCYHILNSACSWRKCLKWKSGKNFDCVWFNYVLFFFIWIYTFNQQRHTVFILNISFVSLHLFD